jgi:hypothetical protein
MDLLSYYIKSRCIRMAVIRERSGVLVTDKIISIDVLNGPHQMVLQRIWRMVPDRDKNDTDLKRLLAFRLRVDGEAATSEYLMRKIRDMIQCAFHGRLYDFLKDDAFSSQCTSSGSDPGPPDIA